MSDNVTLVERLHYAVPDEEWHRGLMAEAADRIAELEAEVARLTVELATPDSVWLAETAARETEAYRAGVLTEREACAQIAVPLHKTGFAAEWAVEEYRLLIRARPAP